VRYPDDGSHPPTQDLVAVEWVDDDGVICTRGGQLALILEVEPVDLARMDEGQVQATLAAYVEFLRWLPWDVQIVRLWEPQDLTPTVRLLEENARGYEGEEEALARTCWDWMSHLEELRLRVAPRVKKLYLVLTVVLTPVALSRRSPVKVKPEVVREKRQELFRRVRMTVQKLGLPAKVLSGEEAVRVLRHAYSPIGGPLVPDTGVEVSLMVRGEGGNGDNR